MERVQLVDAENMFNALTRKTFLHNIAVICSLIATFMHHCYPKPSHLFVISVVAILLSEGTTQGDPVAKNCYKNPVAIKIIPLILAVLKITDQYPHGTSKATAYADDLTAAGIIKGIKYLWEQLCKLEPKFGYFLEATKSWLIVEVNTEDKATEIFGGRGAQITIDGKRDLEASLRSERFKDEYLASKVDEWVRDFVRKSSIRHNNMNQMINH